MAKPLEITFHGPFVFRFGIDYAWAYAPRCKQHHLNILTDSEDVRLPIDKKRKQVRTFHLNGPASGKTALSSSYPVVTYPWDPNNKHWPDKDDNWHYVLRFPAPDSIFGLVPEPVTIYGYQTESDTECDSYARALRFRYNSSESPQFDEIDKDLFNASHLGSAHPDPGYSIEIRYTHYHSVARLKKDFYADAQSCFKSMRKKLPPCDQWKAKFGDCPDESGVQQTRHTIPFKIALGGGPSGPHDCGAPVMALFEEGVSLKPAEPKTNISSTKGKSKK